MNKLNTNIMIISIANGPFISIGGLGIANFCDRLCYGIACAPLK